MRYRHHLILGLAFCAIAGPLAAEELADNEQDRYSFVQVDEGFLKFDKQEGTFSFCSVSGENVVCRVNADERLAYQQSIDAMQARIKTLEDRIAGLEKQSKPDEPEHGSKSEETERFSKDFETAMTFVERAMRRFYSMLQDLHRDFRSDET